MKREVSYSSSSASTTTSNSSSSNNTESAHDVCLTSQCALALLTTTTGGAAFTRSVYVCCDDGEAPVTLIDGLLFHLVLSLNRRTMNAAALEDALIELYWRAWADAPARCETEPAIQAQLDVLAEANCDAYEAYRHAVHPFVWNDEAGKRERQNYYEDMRYHRARNLRCLSLEPYVVHASSPNARALRQCAVFRVSCVNHQVIARLIDRLRHGTLYVAGDRHAVAVHNFDARGVVSALGRNESSEAYVLRQCLQFRTARDIYRWSFAQATRLTAGLLHPAGISTSAPETNEYDGSVSAPASTEATLPLQSSARTDAEAHQFDWLLLTENETPANAESAPQQETAAEGVKKPKRASTAALTPRLNAQYRLLGAHPPVTCVLYAERTLWLTKDVRDRAPPKPKEEAPPVKRPRGQQTLLQFVRVNK